MNSPIKKKQIAAWIRNQNLTIYCLQETHMRQVGTHRVKVKGWSKIYWASTEKKKMGVSLMIFDKAKVKIDLVKRDMESNYILIKGSINNEEIAILNMYTPNGKASQELKEEIDNKTILVGDLNLPLSDLDKPIQKINKKEMRSEWNPRKTRVNRYMEKTQ